MLRLPDNTLNRKHAWLINNVKTSSILINGHFAVFLSCLAHLNTCFSSQRLFVFIQRQYVKLEVSSILNIYQTLLITRKVHIYLKLIYMYTLYIRFTFTHLVKFHYNTTFVNHMHCIARLYKRTTKLYNINTHCLCP